jgi:outer membrane protein TolC
MANLKPIFLLSFCLFGLIQNSLGQTNRNKGKDSLVWNGKEMVSLSSIPVDTILFDLSIDIGRQIEPLDTIIAYAIQFSPELNFEEASIERAQYNTKFTRYLWLNGITGFFNYTLGDQTNLNTVTGTSILNNSLGVGYRYGANVSLPLTEILGRPNRMRQMKAEERMAKYKRDLVETQLKRRIFFHGFI